MKNKTLKVLWEIFFLAVLLGCSSCAQQKIVGKWYNLEYGSAYSFEIFDDGTIAIKDYITEPFSAKGIYELLNGGTFKVKVIQRMLEIPLEASYRIIELTNEKMVLATEEEEHLAFYKAKRCTDKDIFGKWLCKEGMYDLKANGAIYFVPYGDGEATRIGTFCRIHGNLYIFDWGNSFRTVKFAKAEEDILMIITSNTGNVLDIGEKLGH